MKSKVITALLLILSLLIFHFGGWTPLFFWLICYHLVRSIIRNGSTHITGNRQNEGFFVFIATVGFIVTFAENVIDQREKLTHKPKLKSENIESLEDETAFLPSLRPKTGASPWSSVLGFGFYEEGSRNDIRCTAPSDQDIIFFLLNGTGNKVQRHEYIRSGETFVLSEIPAGSYTYRYIAGNLWSKSKPQSGSRLLGAFLENQIFVVPEGDNEILEFPPGFKTNFEFVFEKLVSGNLATTNISDDEFMSFD